MDGVKMMTDVGFYHPDRGYWQAIDVTGSEHVAELLSGYPIGTTEVPLIPGPNYVYQSGAWVYVAPTIEELRAAMPTITRRQIQLGLVMNGIDLTQVDAVIAAIVDPVDRQVAQIEWREAGMYERTHSLIIMVGNALGLTPEQIDTMWTQALTL